MDRRRASGWRTIAGDGSRCCPACRARCAACSPTRCLPRLASRVTAGTVVRSLTLRTTGVAESLLADQIESIAGGPLGVSLAYLPSISGVDLRLTVRDVMPRRCGGARCRGAAARLRAKVGESIYGEDDDDLAAVVLELCRERMLTIGVAESCTGGLLGARLTAVPGSSDVVRGGVIAYHNDVKRDLLGVDAGDASRARGGERTGGAADGGGRSTRRAARASGLAITGVAGPDGRHDREARRHRLGCRGHRGRRPDSTARLWGGRDEVRQRAAQWTHGARPAKPVAREPSSDGLAVAPGTSPSEHS